MPVSYTHLPLCTQIAINWLKTYYKKSINLFPLPILEITISEKEWMKMPIDFRNSETKDNLMRAFAGESQARNRYTFAASQAKKDGLHVIEAVFTFTANQEKEHAEIFYNHLKELAGETIVVDGGYPVDIYPDIKPVSYTHLDVYKRQMLTRLLVTSWTI